MNIKELIEEFNQGASSQEIESNFCKIADNLPDFFDKFKKVDN